MNTLKVGTRFFSEFNTWVDGSETFGTPEKDIEMVEILGRNGSLTISNDRYKNLELTYQCYIKENFLTNYRALTEYLNSLDGYQRIEFSKEQMHYRMGLFRGLVQPSPTAFTKGGFFGVTFDCKPQRFLKTGDNWLSVSSGNTINNLQLFASRPVLRITGSGTLNIGDQYITITAHSFPYIDIDCEMMNAYYESNNANGYVSFSTTGNIELKPGANTFVYDCTSVQVQPRWYEV